MFGREPYLKINIKNVGFLP